MLTGTVWGITLIALGTVATFAAAQVLLAAVFASRADAARRALRRSPWICGLVGVPVGAALVAAVAVAGAILKRAPAVPGAMGIAAGLLAMFGLAVVASEVGSRLPSSGPAAGGWRGLLRGSVTVTLAGFLPFAGWIVIFPACVACGLGAWFLSFVTHAARSGPGGADFRGDEAAPFRHDVPAEVGA